MELLDVLFWASILKAFFFIIVPLIGYCSAFSTVFLLIKQSEKISVSMIIL